MQPANLLKIDTLEPGWTDKDQVMLHACFQLLTDFLTKENLAIVNWMQNETIQEARKEMDTLAAWWQQRVLIEKEGSIDPILTDNQYEKDNEMLIRLIKVRQYLWT